MSDGEKDICVRIDDREKRVYDILGEHHPEVACERVRLTTGDFQVWRGGTAALVVERKTRSDLHASLLDGRFHTQRARMVREFGSDKVAYIIEGGTCWEESASAAEIGIVLRDRIPVLWSSGLDDTAALLARLSRCDVAPRDSPPSGELSVPTARSAQNSPEASLAAMLRCVPGVSASRALLLSAKFGSMSKLVGRIAQDSDAVVADIASFRASAGKNAFGQALARRVVACVGCD